jgi:cytochrome c oxidase subunit 2
VIEKMLKQPLLGMTVALLTGVMAKADEFNMPVGVTDVSRDVYDLHMLIFYICCIIGVVVFGAMFYSMYSHRKSRGHDPAQFHESTRVEILWTIIPLFILIGMAIPATQVLIRMSDTGDEDMTVEVRGYQWKWRYTYLDDDLNDSFRFFSNLATPRDEINNKSVKGEFYLLEVDHPLIVPVNRKIRFLITSEDVIHSWWVPDFGGKKDAIPGMLNETWALVKEPGIFRGQCTELCGKDHGFMPVVVQALPEEEYDAWYQDRVIAEEARRKAMSKTFTADELMVEGEKVYAAFCSSCHQPNGQGIPPAFPALKGSAIATGDRDAHVRLVYNGKNGTAMQAFGKQLDAVQLAAVVHYERHAFGNNANDITQPIDVINLTAGQ